MTIPATVVDLTMHYITGITIKRLTGSLGSTWYEIIVKDHSGAPLIVTAFCRPDVALELLGDIPVVASVAA